MGNTCGNCRSPRVGEGFGFFVHITASAHRPRGVGVKRPQVVDVPQQMGPQRCLGPRSDGRRRRYSADQRPGELFDARASATTALLRPRRCSVGVLKVQRSRCDPPASPSHRWTTGELASAPWALWATFWVAATMASQAEKARAEVPWNPERQPGSRNATIADQVNPQPLLAHHHLVQLRRRRATPSEAPGADNVGVFHNFHRNRRQSITFPRPAPDNRAAQYRSICSNAGPRKAARARFARFPGRAGLPSALGFRPIRPEPLALARPSTGQYASPGSR